MDVAAKTRAWLRDGLGVARFSWGLPGYLRQTVSPAQAEAVVRARLAGRQHAFLRLIERGVFGHRASPYRALLDAAGCSLGDVRSLLHSHGLEGALEALRRAGVYVTFEEFKGRRPLVRHGRHIPTDGRSFDNPFLSRYYGAETGGTTGPGTRTAYDLEHLAAQAASVALALHIYGVYGAPAAVWLSILPAASGLNSTLRQSRAGTVPRRWFTPVVPGDLAPSLRSTLLTRYMVAVGRLSGVRLPAPEPLRLDQAVVLARWAAETARAEGRSLVMAHVSQGVRVAAAALEAGIDLSGVTITVGGEPPTAAKAEVLRRSGAEWHPGYWITEAGGIAYGCTHPVSPNDLHLLSDSFALIQHPHPGPGALFLTTLLPTSPRLMLNVETDDHGLIEARSCGCPFEAIGLRTHLREVHSQRKLTGEGMTVLPGEIVRLVEELLPARFGGSPLDYQIVEEEHGGLTVVSLVVSPRLRLDEQAQVVPFVLQSLRQGSRASELAAAVWKQAGTLRLVRREPSTTARGKARPVLLTSASLPPADDGGTPRQALRSAQGRTHTEQPSPEEPNP